MKYCRVQQPDLAVLDVEMPGLNSLDLLQELKAIMPALPVVMMSSSHDKNTIMRACESGANIFFPKPFDTDMFCRKIECILRSIDFYH